ncbi:UNVERIFIED_CONTAM: Chromosome transmission fidelity protein 18 [Siphonaria sp. JEL0065]|nr:Chromosome transmission fidelity protein 18 [Siphonaria sp. JEL0065]
MEMFGSGVKPKSLISPLDIPPRDLDQDEDDEGGLFSDSDVDENILKPWNNRDKVKLGGLVGIKRKVEQKETEKEKTVLANVFSSDDDDDDGPKESVPKRKYKPLSLSDSEDESGNDNEDVTQRSIAKITETGFYGGVGLVTDKEMGLGTPKRAMQPRRPKSPTMEYDKDGEPIFQYPDSSDEDEQYQSQNQNRPQPNNAMVIDDNNNIDPNSPSHKFHRSLYHHPRNQHNLPRTRKHTEQDNPMKPRLFSTDNPTTKALSPLPTGGRKKAPSKAELEARHYKQLMIIAQQMKREIEARKVGASDGEGGASRSRGITEFGLEYEPRSEQQNFLLMPTDGRSWRTAVDSKGRRLYFPYKRHHEVLAKGGDPQSFGRRADLLGESIHVMLRRLEDEMVRLADEESARRAIFERMGTQEAREVLGEELERGGVEGKQDGKLWVDKYSPRMYIDLVGDERINREVLTWVKQWDYCVFKKPIRKNQGNQNQNDWQKPLDAFNRPEKKILLLSGPAGLGKTTLAHIVGRHSGYNVIEINASDDRTGESLRNKLIGAIESQSLNSKKPNLIIIDEIDGASSGGGDQVKGVPALDLANGELKKGGGSKEKTDGDEPTDKNAKKVKTRNRVLLRPIICICNDQYAPVLRPLRQISQSYTFKPPAHRILANRLTEICKQEGLQTDLRTLMALCELTDGDIRSSLNTLQFFRRKGQILTLEMLAGMDIGHKDMTRGLFRVWEDVFMVPSGKRKKKIACAGGRDEASGEVDKIVQGCHENCLKMRIVDSIASSSSDQSRTPTKIEQALDWLVFHDKLDRFIVVDKDFELFKYQPFTVVNFYRLFAGILKPTIEFPRADYDNFIARRANENIISSFINTLSLHERVTWGNRGRLLEELVTPLLQIISPDFRAVNVNLLKPNEKLILDKLINIMVSFGLKFIQEKGEDGHYVFKLWPAIEKLVIGKSDSAIGDSRHSQQITYPVKQLISKEIETESIRRSIASSNERMKKMAGQGTGSLFGKRNVDLGNDQDAEAGDVALSQQGKTPKKRSDPTPSQLIIPIPIKTVKAIAKDFFGRPIVVVDENESVDIPMDGATVVKRKRVIEKAPEPLISYKFNEGFSNAVRKPMKVREFM